MNNEELAFANAAASDNYGYHRFESWKLSGVSDDVADYVCRIWHYDATSPSGRVLAATLTNFEEARRILKQFNRI